MVKNICKDINFLSLKSDIMTKEDSYIISDLKDTLKFHSNGCVGMAANMIGYNKRCIIYINEKEKMEIMINPIIIKKEMEYEALEGCLSLEGVRKTKRYKKIKVEYYNTNFEKRIKTFKDFTAQIIQHEIDHLHGIII